MRSATFAFPSNVLARALELEEGRLDHLHVGLAQSTDEPLWQAQERATQRLLSVLPPPCRVLQFGIGVGTELRRLVDAGYTALGLTGDAALAAEVNARHGSAVRTLVASLRELDVGLGPWDLMLAHGGLQCMPMLELFECADRLLATNDACIVVMDEFVLDRRGPAQGGPHCFDHFVALARRMGWQVIDEQDLSSQASDGLRALRLSVERQRATLQRDLKLDSAALEDFIAAARRSEALCAEGLWAYRLLKLGRRGRPGSRLAAVTAANSGEARVLFEQVFGQPMSAAEWHWKYGDGRGQAVGLWRDDRLVAHYGATTRAIRMDGQLVSAAQVGDVMVLPQANAGIERQGPLQQVAATLLEGQIGWGLPHRVGFGFPSARHLRVAQRLGLYAPVGEVLQLEWPVAPQRHWSDALWRHDEIDPAALKEDSAVWRQLQVLWDRMADGLPRALLPQRDPAWLRHRYGRRPGVVYRLFVWRRAWGGRPQAAFVLRIHDDHAELMDVVGPPPLLRRVVRAARWAAHSLGRERLLTWVTESHAGWLDDPADLALRTGLGVQVPTCMHTAGPAPADLQGRWFLLSGDTDFR